jgi:hypothetical protein
MLADGVRRDQGDFLGDAGAGQKLGRQVVVLPALRGAGAQPSKPADPPR